MRGKIKIGEARITWRMGQNNKKILIWEGKMYRVWYSVVNLFYSKAFQKKLDAVWPVKTCLFDAHTHVTTPVPPPPRMFKKQKPTGGLKFYIFSLDSLSLSRRFCLDCICRWGEKTSLCMRLMRQRQKDFNICVYFSFAVWLWLITIKGVTSRDVYFLLKICNIRTVLFICAHGAWFSNFYIFMYCTVYF